jgi:hypothetical protein
LVVFLVCGVMPAALLAAAIAVPAALWSRLPRRVADHWTVTGTANGTALRGLPFATLGVLVVIGVGLAWFGWAATRRGLVPRGRAGLAGGWGGVAVITLGLYLAALGTGSVIMVAVASLGGGGPRAESVGVPGLVGLIGGPVVIAMLAGYALRRLGGLGATDDGEPRPRLGLRSGERAVWTGRARATWARPAGALLVAAGLLVGVVAARWTYGGALLAVGVALLAFTSVRVTVAARGVAVGYGPLGLRLTRIPLRRIASATAVDQRSWAFGYRGSLLLFGAALVAVRRGPALRLTLRDGKTFMVTVDDAATGAALLNDLIAGATQSAGHGGAGLAARGQRYAQFGPTTGPRRSLLG